MRSLQPFADGENLFFTNNAKSAAENACAMPAGRSVTEWIGMNAGQEVLLVGCSLFLFDWAKIPAGIVSMHLEG